MNNVKFSSLSVASYLSGSDYITIVRSGSATQSDTGIAPNNYIVQAQYFTSSWANNARTSSYFNAVNPTGIVRLHAEGYYNGTDEAAGVFLSGLGNQGIKMVSAEHPSFITAWPTHLELSTVSHQRSNLTINQAGNVGIGVSNGTQTQKLEVNGNVTMSGNVGISGNLGIGTSSPASKLHVVGTARFNELEFGSAGAVFGQSLYRISELNDVLYQSDKRFTVTTSSGMSSAVAGLFDGSFDGIYSLPVNSTNVIRITMPGVVYPEGGIYVSFYSTNNSYSGISARVYKTQTAAWESLGTPTDLSVQSGCKVIKFVVGPNNGLTDIELTITTDTNVVQLTSINYFQNRSGIQERPYVSKYLNENSVFGTLNVKTNTNVDNVRLSGTGNSYLAASTGKVGIGVTSPLAKLHVSGSRLDNSARILVTDETGGIARLNADGYYNNTDEAAGVFLSGPANQGIKMVSAGVASYITATPTNLSLGYAGQPSLSFLTNARLNFWGQYEIVSSGSANFIPLTIITADNQSSNVISIGKVTTPGSYLTINGEGNVGIGTSSPLANLDVGASAGQQLFYNNETLILTTTPILRVSSNNASNATQAKIGISLSNTSATNNTYSPVLAFSRRSTSGTFNAPYAEIAGIATGDGASTDWVKGVLTFLTAPVGNVGPIERMRIDEAGYVGIGTPNPSHQLTLSTDSAKKPTSNVWDTVSDERIKTDIVPADLSRCYEIVKQVGLKHFGFKPGVYNDGQIKDKHTLGFIAQDVQKVFGKAVSVSPFTLQTDIPDGIEEYEEQDFTLETVDKVETSIQVLKGKPVQVSKVVTSENKVMLFDMVDVLDESGVAVMESYEVTPAIRAIDATEEVEAVESIEAVMGTRPVTYKMPRMITKTRPKVRHEVIEDCLNLNSGQMNAALYGAVQCLMAKVEAQAVTIAALQTKVGE